MKKVLSSLLLLLSVTGLFSQGISFQHSSLEEAINKASKENKMIFMDCYTTWCGPCKQLSKKVFPSEKLGEFFNTHFVNLKVDMEQAEGIELAKKYKVQAFPTLLFINTKGEVVHKAIGYMGADALLEQAKIALDPKKNSMAVEKNYEANPYDIDAVLDYLSLLDQSFDYVTMRKVGQKFFSKQEVENIKEDKLIRIAAYSGFVYKDKWYTHLMMNKSKFIDLMGEEVYEEIMIKTLAAHLYELSLKVNEDELLSESKRLKGVHGKFISKNASRQMGYYSEF